MRLLVSVRSASEVGLALTGGADIIDAKEPDRGSLGPVSAQALAEILGCLPLNRPFSVALGDVATEADVVDSITSLHLPVRAAPTFLKLGFAGVRSPQLVGGLLTMAVKVAQEQPSAPLIVAVAYADSGRAEALPPEVISRLSHYAGTAGVLLDTYIKDGIGLLHWLDPAQLAEWISGARRAGLLTAVAGSLELDDVEPVAWAGPDVVGVRGSACVGGRGGQISTRRVRELRRRLGHGPSGETRDHGADLATARWAKSLKNNA